MIGLIVLLLISWGILRLQRKSLSVLGLKPTWKRSSQFFTGFLIASFIALIYYFYTAFVLNARIDLNIDYRIIDFFQGSYWTLKSVLWEELLFRGVLLYTAIRFIGSWKAIILSSVIFGVYHWFSYNLIGEVVSMIYIFLLTGIAGALFAYSYVLTRSMFLQIALHFGWNFISINIFSQGPLGNQLLLVTGADAPGLFYSFIFFLIQFIVFPGLIYLYLRQLEIKKKVPV